MSFLKRFCHDESGQDLIEYTLLMAFVALASAALFIGAGGSIQGIWSATNNQLSAANASASGRHVRPSPPLVTRSAVGQFDMGWPLA